MILEVDHLFVCKSGEVPGLWYYKDHFYEWYRIKDGIISYRKSSSHVDWGKDPILRSTTDFITLQGGFYTK